MKLIGGINMKTAYFDPRGCDFWADEKYISDVGNYRLVACVMAKNGEPVIIEFGGWQRREQYVSKNGKTKTRIANENALYVNGEHTCYNERTDSVYGPEAGCYGFNFESIGIDEKDYDYTRADLLRFISDVTGEQYDNIVFDREKVEEQIEAIYKPVERELYGKAREARQKIENEREKEREASREKLRLRLKEKQMEY